MRVRVFVYGGLLKTRMENHYPSADNLCACVCACSVEGVAVVKSAKVQWLYSLSVFYVVSRALLAPLRGLVRWLQRQALP